MNVAFCEFLGTKRRSSNYNLLREGFAMESNKLRRNGYPENIINQMLSRAINHCLRQLNKNAKKQSITLSS